ncbi:hypothetical protein UFOVP1362_15 [uncultured Caudovirales phage]|uniref:Uncharacterized protein n=1 Tax=uncultured Caudovirales phage TaxID=2100421 RepID=A0A6J5RUJ5_9CAUD|nr:hypothetical protein UFOVP1101_11 [uncultured Caudovirales phage]CAB4201927.1 hypothetical protein UFOVP1362_15 [uncultured Caudovirales phage]
MKDLYRGDGGPLSSYDEGWNDGVEAAEKALSSERDAAVAALKAARKTLSYCAVNPMELHPSNNMQHIVASNALGDLDEALRDVGDDA